MQIRIALTPPAREQERGLRVAILGLPGPHRSAEGRVHPLLRTRQGAGEGASLAALEQTRKAMGLKE